MYRTKLSAALALTLFSALAACSGNNDTAGRVGATGGSGGIGIGIGDGVDCVNGPNHTDCPCTAGESVACYTGSAATRGIGACKDGVQTCTEKQELHFSFGPCTGEVLPSAADACTPGDACGAGCSDGGPPTGDDQHVVQVDNLGVTLCAVTTAGHVACGGQYPGDGVPITSGTTALQWVPGISNAIAISGNTGPCVLQSTGKVVCWGQNEHGQCGDGTATVALQAAPLEVKGLTDAVEIASGVWHTCARRATGEVVCWGDNCIGELGDGNGHNPMYPNAMCAQPSGIPTPNLVKVVGITDAVQITAGTWHTCARLKGGAVKCWGIAANGQLGDGSSGLANDPPLSPTWMVHASPVDVVGLSDAVDVAAGNGTTCAVRANGQVACWGGGENGGGGTKLLETSVVPVVNPALTGVTTMRIWAPVVCALLKTGEVTCWGGNQGAGLGNGMLLPANNYTQTTAPGSPVLGFSDAIRLDVGCAVRSTHTGLCWGRDTLGSNVKDGQGQTSNKYFLTPTEIVLPKNSP
jgi:alpha-tubulin suppressor-like RCC1 family protein